MYWLCFYSFAYVTHEDICSCFQGDTLLAIQAPSGTQMEVPIPEFVSDNLYDSFSLFQRFLCQK